MDNILALTVIEMKVPSTDGGYIVVSLESNKEDSVSSGIEDIILSGNITDITENLKKFTSSYGNENTEAFLFDNGKLHYCSLPPPEDGIQDLTIVRNFGGIFRNEDGIIEGRGSVKMFPSLIAAIPRKVASDNCIFIPTPAGILQENRTVSFEQGYLKKQFETIMNTVKKSSEKILLAPIWYNPITSAEHNTHNVFLSINVDKSKKNGYIVGHFIDTLDNLEQHLYSTKDGELSSLMTYAGLSKSDIEGIKFINTYNLQGREGKTCTNFTEANLFLAANIIATNPDIDYKTFFKIISSKTFQILSAKTVLDRIDPMQRAITFDPNKTIGRRYEFLPRKIVKIEPKSIRKELLDSSTLCTICEFENLGLYKVPTEFNADDGLRPVALLPLIRTLPIDQVEKLKYLFFKKIYDKYNKASSDKEKFKKKFNVSFNDFKDLYINTSGHNKKSDEKIRSDFESLVEKTKIFEVESRSFLPPRLSGLEECYIELFNILIQTEQQIVNDEIEIYSIISDSIEKESFDLNNVKNIGNIPRAMLYIMNSNKLNEEEKSKSIQNILFSFSKEGKGIMKKKELLDLLSTKPKFGELLYTQLDRIKENNKTKGKPYRTIELFSEDLKHDIAMAIWHPETVVKTI